MNIKISKLLLLITSVILFSCNSDDEKSNSPSPNSSTNFRVSMGSRTYSTDTANFDVNSNTIQIYASKQIYTETFIINFEGVATGNYDFTTNATATYSVKSGPGVLDYDVYQARRGNVNLTAADTANSISGNFSFTAINVSDPTDSIVFTNGSFTLPREN